MDPLWLALIYAAQTQVLLRLQSRAQQTLLQRRSPVSFSFLLRIHEQECPIFSSFPVLSERFSDWQLYRHLPADAEGKAFAKDFVATPPAVPQPSTQPLAAPQPLTATATATATAGAPTPAAPAKPATVPSAPPHPAASPPPSASACCVLN